MMESLSGKNVKLRAPSDEDFEYFAHLRNDLRTQGWNQRLPPCFTAARLKERFAKNIERGNSGFFAIEVGGELIGYVNYDEGERRLGATLGISVGPEHWGKGHAQEAAEVILRFLFEERGVHVLWLWTRSGNDRGIGLAKKLGFKESGRLRESIIIGGKVHDTLLMDLLREEYNESRGLEEKIMDRRP